MGSSTQFSSIRITKQCLNGNNYSSWTKKVVLYFTGQRKMSHLTADPPTDQSQLENWQADDAQLLHLLFESMEPEVSDLFSHVITCKQAWDYAKLLYSSNMLRMYDVSVELFHAKQEGSLTDYFAKVKQGFKELNALLPISSDVQEMHRQREHLVIMTFLAGLKPEFEPVRAQILGGVELPSLPEVYSRLSRSFAKESPTNYSSDRSVLAVQSNPQARSGSQVRGGLGGSRVGRGGRGGRGRGPRPHCTYCGKDGHIEDTCWDKDPSLRAAYMASKADSSSAGASQPSVTLSHEEYTKFLQYESAQLAASPPMASVVHRGNPTACYSSSLSKNQSWVLDSGATDHISGKIAIFLSNISSSFTS